MKLNWHSIFGALVSGLGWVVTSGVVNTQALPAHWAPWIGIAGLIYAAASGKAVSRKP